MFSLNITNRNIQDIDAISKVLITKFKNLFKGYVVMMSIRTGVVIINLRIENPFSRITSIV